MARDPVHAYDNSRTDDCGTERYFCSLWTPSLVLDNGLRFVSGEFKEFMAANVVKQICSSPYNPATNGAAERVVQTTKKASRQEGLPLEKATSSFLLCYRSTPCSTTGLTPSSLFMGCELRTCLDLMAPDVGGHVRDRQPAQEAHDNRHCRAWKLQVTQPVWAKNSRVMDQVGPLFYLVELPDGRLWHRHIDDLRAGDQPADLLR